MMDFTKELQYEMATRFFKKGFITESRLESFKERGNKGILNECLLLEKLNLKQSFDNHQGADLEYQGVKIQFKYMGLKSKPSATETKKNPDETKEAFINRIIKKYNEVDEYWIYIGNDMDMNLDNIVKLTTNEFKSFLLDQNIKDNDKIRLTGKNKLKKYQYR